VLVEGELPNPERRAEDKKRQADREPHPPNQTQKYLCEIARMQLELGHLTFLKLLAEQQ